LSDWLLRLLFPPFLFLLIAGTAIRPCCLLKETAMRYAIYIVAIAMLAGAVTGCTDQYYPGSGYSQNYYSPSAYNYPANYSSYPAGSGYYPNRYGYGSTGDYNRNYGGTRSGPQVTFTLPN
jgi:hypothetical protein